MSSLTTSSATNGSLPRAPAGANQWKPKGDAGRRYRARSARPLKAPLAVLAHHRPRPAFRSRLRKDLPALPRESRAVRRCLCPCVVQADAPRHGSAPPPRLSRPGSPRPRSSSGKTPIPRRRSQTDRRAGHRRTQGQDSCFGLVRFLSWFQPPGPRRPPSVAPTKRGGANGARIRLAPAEGLERQPAGATRKGAEDA